QRGVDRIGIADPERSIARERLGDLPQLAERRRRHAAAAADRDRARERASVALDREPLGVVDTVAHARLKCVEIALRERARLTLAAVRMRIPQGAADFDLGVIERGDGAVAPIREDGEALASLRALDEHV